MMQGSMYAKMILDIVPSVMRYIRIEMRSLAKSELTIPQFRILARLSISETTNRELAEWIGVSAPTMTRMVDGLVKKNLVKRTSQVGDRRQIQLNLTEKGLVTFSRLRGLVQNKLAEKVEELTGEKKRQLANGLKVLREMFL